MRKLSHESLTVYQRSVSFVAWSSDLCRSKREIVGEIQNQYKRAFISIPLNIAEGVESSRVKIRPDSTIMREARPLNVLPVWMFLSQCNLCYRTKLSQAKSKSLKSLPC